MAALSDNTKGALLMMCSMAAFTFNDTLIKSLGPQVPLFQMLFLRGAMASVLIWLLARRVGRLRWRLARRDWGLIGLRTGAEIGAAYFFITALYHMPIANVTAILQILPLTVTLGGALFFGESVGWRRASAIVAGFCGMLLIVRPGAEGFDHYTVYALIAVGFVTLRDLATRKMSAEVPSMTVTLVASLGVMSFAGVASLGADWVRMELAQWALLAGAAVFILGGYLFSVLVMRVGEVSFVAPFRYSGLLWALLLGFLVFDDWPDPITLLGALIVVSAGVFTLVRGRRLSQAKTVRT
ncbi:DMT family transporter [Shimia marina]|uniref:Phosphonate utilization associated putative membrane protein n=1 Tax=Shimia marina TaxID=321267 RepID=A0A0P1FG49_9RHOB|nr:DMT family transporter [Shimia marina]CUH52625.1 phosphonate utilization associated putative membrane protein [Shimia marina]SFE52044.1 S-adenosylmethionine uptake transporter [Shimia marina]